MGAAELVEERENVNEAGTITAINEGRRERHDRDVLDVLGEAVLLVLCVQRVVRDVTFAEDLPTGRRGTGREE